MRDLYILFLKRCVSVFCVDVLGTISVVCLVEAVIKQISYGLVGSANLMILESLIHCVATFVHVMDGAIIVVGKDASYVLLRLSSSGVVLKQLEKL